MKKFLPHKRSKVFLVMLSFVSFSCIANIPNDIDSSQWQVDPVKTGMTAKEYIQADSRAFFWNFIGRTGLNDFYSFKSLAKAKDHWVVSPNLDTIYSIAVVNVKKGFVLKVPKDGNRFISIQIIDENHASPFYIYGGGSYHFKASDFQSDYVGVGVRIGTNGYKDDVKHILNDLQPNLSITNAATDMTMPKPDMKKLEATTAALLAAYKKLPNTFNTMVKSSSNVKDWERFTYVTAGAWGLSQDENAMYMIGGGVNTKANLCYTAIFPKIPAEAFFSITLYGADNYLMSDENNVIGSNHKVKAAEDGSFKVAFGPEKCRSLAPNYAYTNQDGWNYLIRAYKPNVQSFGKYQIPQLNIENRQQ